jgi:cell wall-associated NlpC family hydrolase
VGRLLAWTPGRRRVTALVATALTAAGIAAWGTAAGAAPRPTVSQVQAQVNGLQAKVDQIGEQYDHAGQQLAAARGRLAQVNGEAARAQGRYSAARARFVQAAATAYEDSGQMSIAGVLISGDPAAALGQASLLLQLAGTRQAQASQFLAGAQQLESARLQQQRTEDGIVALRAQLTGKKAALSKLLAGRQALLGSLTGAQQAQVAASAVGAGGSTTAVYTGPTATQAEKAVAFAYAQLGKPYVWGATGPGSYDCSGLVQAAWAAAGVSVPRVTYDQWGSLPHIATSALQPGDLLFYNGEGHVSMYVGDGYIIDAPRTGLSVQKIPMNTDWYASAYEGAVRP